MKSFDITYGLRCSHVWLLLFRRVVVIIFNQLFIVIIVGIVLMFTIRFGCPTVCDGTVGRLNVRFRNCILLWCRKSLSVNEFEKKLTQVTQIFMSQKPAALRHEMFIYLICSIVSPVRIMIVVLVASLASIRRISLRITFRLQIALREIMSCRRRHRQTP